MTKEDEKHLSDIKATLARIEEKLTNVVTKEQCSEHRSCLKLSVYKLYFMGLGAIGVLGIIAKVQGFI